MSAATPTKRARTTHFSRTILASLSKLQDALNRIVDADWRSKRTPADWALACTMESTELIDSYPWKWWKNVKAQPDINNVKIELVDILHFALSGAMQTADVPPTPLPQGVASAIVTPLVEAPNAVATFRNVIRLADMHRFDIVTEHCIAGADDLEFNLVAYYVAKHTLNYIRQLGGYKSGEYKKVQNGREDNELLHDAISGVTLDEALAEDAYASTWDAIMLRVYTSFNIPEEQRKTVGDWLGDGTA
jgi:dUTP pyrophosphatase